MFGGRKGGMPNLTVLGRDLIWSGVVCRSQQSVKAKPRVVHSDRLKPYLGPPLERWNPKRQTQLSIPREEGREAEVDSPEIVEDGQSAPVKEREGVELVERVDGERRRG